jgi:hypothetical protein
MKKSVQQAPNVCCRSTTVELPFLSILVLEKIFQRRVRTAFLDLNPQQSVIILDERIERCWKTRASFGAYSKIDDSML